MLVDPSNLLDHLKTEGSYRVIVYASIEITQENDIFIIFYYNHP